jgi:NADPH:quinone reductase-like Zn-dependent oxidoreductase
VPGQGRVVGPLGLLVRAQIHNRSGKPPRTLTPLATPDASLLDDLAGLARTGHLAPVIDARFPIEAAADAIRYMETEHTTGKVVVTVP